MKPGIVNHTIHCSVAALILVISLAVNASAAGSIFGGTLIRSTPFDFKVSQTGLFNESETAAFPKAESLDSLFLKARSFRYAPDSRGDHWQTPDETESKHMGDCEDKAVWLYAQLKKNGYSNVRLVIGKYRSFDRKFHVWVAYIDDSGKVFVLDPAIQKRVWEITGFSGGFYKPLYSYDGRSRYRHVAS